MNCKDVKENLSAYIDDMLDKQIRTLVDEHLAVCRSCREELASLLFVIEDLKDAGSLKAPENFIESLHERLDAPSYWSRIKEILFVPAQIKIPLEFAAVSIVAVLVFTVYSVYSPGNHIAGFMKDAVMESSGEEPVVHEGETGRPGSFSHQNAAADADYVEAAKQPSLEIALVLRDEIAAAADSPAEVKAKTQGSARALLENQVTASSPTQYKAASPGTALPLDEPAKSADALKKEEEENVITPDKKPDFYKGHESVRRILDLVGLSGGRVLSEEFDETGRQDPSIFAEIPYAQYRGFIEKLSGIADLNGPPPSIPDDHGDAILVRMRLMHQQ
ncbi:MAG: zf-HC2 domain-containing protein [Deltaproteobacteria bacterium]|nr:zf-HC2 domain-containing protein [Deltaproteobacteria bacterium]